MNEMKIETQLEQLFEIIVQEVNANHEFAKKIRGIFNANEKKPHQTSRRRGGRGAGELSATNPTEHANTALPSVTSKRKTRRRNAALFNPETILEEHGEGTLLDSLNQLEVDQLKDIVSEFGMDPAKKVMKWKKKDRFVAHIVEVTNHRLQKGGAFRRIN